MTKSEALREIDRARQDNTMMHGDLKAWAYTLEQWILDLLTAPNDPPQCNDCGSDVATVCQDCADEYNT